MYSNRKACEEKNCRNSMIVSHVIPMKMIRSLRLLEILKKNVTQHGRDAGQ